MVTGQAFADSSALVKRYAEEADDAIVRDLDDLAVSSLALVEVASAIWRKARLGHLDASGIDATLRGVQADLHGGPSRRASYAVIRPTDRILARASQIVGADNLRAFDAVQLASAEMARELIPECTRFVCFDDRLRAAAADHGFALVPA